MYIGRHLRVVIASAAVLTAAAGIANATTFNTSLVDPPGFYNGSGSPNVGFTTNTVGGIEFGLSAVLRNVGPITPSGNVYEAPTGTNPAGTHALWNFQFSINVRADGNTTGLLSQINPLLTIETLGGPLLSFNPFLIPDNAGWNGSEQSNVNSSTLANNYGIQNSENLMFAFLQGPLGFDPYAHETYRITLSATGANQNDLGSVSIDVVTTPLPGALPLFATALGAMGLLGWRRKRKAAAAA